MDYGALIRDSWTTTWRYRYLWLLGLFAGGTAGGFGGGGGGGNRSVSWREPGGFVPPDGDLRVATEQLGTWTAANAGWLIAGAVAAVLIGLALVIVGLIAQGGMAEATVDIAQGRETSLGRAWRTGLRLFWRYAGLWLTLALGAFAIALFIGAIVAAAVAIGAAGYSMGGGEGMAVVALIAGILVGIPITIGIVMAAIALSIVVAFAQRAIYVDDAGPVQALGIGWRTLRAHVGTSILTWLVFLALGIAAGIAGALILLPVIGLAGGLGYAAYLATGVGAPLIAMAALAIIAVLAAGAVLTGIANTFFWNYWTRAYLRLHV